MHSTSFVAAAVNVVNRSPQWSLRFTQIVLTRADAIHAIRW
jgi:hypothetical protein